VSSAGEIHRGAQAAQAAVLREELGALGPVGVVGLGVMGGRISARLAMHGLRVLGYDPAASAATPRGVERCSTFEELAHAAKTVLLSLPSSDALAMTVELLVSTAPSAVRTVIDLSTVGVEAERSAGRSLNEAGIELLDCPVSGAVAGAASGQLSVMVGGDADVLARLLPLLEVIGSRVTHIGSEVGHGQVMKVVNNAISGTTLAVTCEALAVGTKLGLDLTSMLEVLNCSSGRSVASERKLPEQVVTGAYAHGGPGLHFTKDIGLFLDAASATEITTTVAEVAATAWRTFTDHWGDADQTAYFPYVLGADRPGSADAALGVTDASR
jgi:3-hydroxyisobutyrate dehydrogenase-like beta-hydroxyacid dehydrogenase